MKFELLVLCLAVYNIWYGAFCWIVAGTPGLLLGNILMICAVIAGVLLVNYKNKEEENFENEKTRTNNNN